MTRIGVALWTAFSISCAAALLSPAPASAGWAGAKCLQFQLENRKYEFVASNGTSVFDLRSTGAGIQDIQGTAEAENKQSLRGGIWHGKVFGKLDGNNLQLNVYWETGATTVFVGTINAIGRLEGYSYQAESPEVRAIWNSSRAALCMNKEITAFCKQYAETVMNQIHEYYSTLHCKSDDDRLFAGERITYEFNCMNLDEDKLYLAEDIDARNKKIARCRELHQNVEIIEKPDAPSHQLMEKKLGRAAKPKFGPLVPHQPLTLSAALRLLPAALAALPSRSH